MKSISSGVAQDEAPEKAKKSKESVSNFVFSDVSLDKDISVNLIRSLELFLDVVSSLDESLHWYFRAVDFLLGRTS